MHLVTRWTIRLDYISMVVFVYLGCNYLVCNFKSNAVSVSKECFDLLVAFMWAITDLFHYGVPVTNFTRIMIPGSSWPHPPPTTNTRIASSATPLHESTTKKPFLHIHPRTLKTNQGTTLRWCLNKRRRVEETTRPWVIRGGRGPWKPYMWKWRNQEVVRNSIMRVKSATGNCLTEKTGN